MRVIIAGCGRVGSVLAAQLASEGHDVWVIDNRAAGRHALPPGFAGHFEEGDCLGRHTLERAGVGDADALVAVTSADNRNLVCARTAKETYRVPMVLARVNDVRRAELAEELGVPTIEGVRWTVHQIHQRLLHRHLSAAMTFGNGEVRLLRSDIPGYLPGRSLSEFDIDGEIRVVEVTRAGRSLIPRHSTTAEAGDMVTFAVAVTALGRLRGFLDKELGT
ncbi:TrkA family potassium uptake protein [Streptomyces finlayi]|uniref:Trk system potassium uptake protein TrkA n=1 Tax=Streptomyces finlayi TaxID=67296 RepID=A0A7G7BDG2_9ACTN|nr:TrkA family potassium uptake protein [Streptomyces finlayi]QNE73377.1 TrkA family potassium uptake protein [Streptomyces finlayi]